MASHNVSRAVHATVMLLTVDTITLDPVNSVRIHNRGSGALYYRLDGSNPGVAADDSLYMGPGENRLIACPDPQSPEVRVCAPVATAYSIEGE